MSIHLCRDLVTLPTASSPGTNMYALAIFLHHVLGFNVVAQRNFPLESSSYEKGGGTTLSGSYLYASMSLGAASNYQVFVPTASYLVSNSDVNRILALKSDAYPKANSGLFRITSATLSPNVLTIDYRTTTGTLSPPDPGLQWRIYEAETIVRNTWSSGSNSPGTSVSSSTRFGYGSWDAGVGAGLIASASRIILQSPDESQWQVRLCLESEIDVKSGSCPGGFTIAPGLYSSTPPYEKPTGKTLHGPLFNNTTSSLYRGMAVGLGPAMVNNNWTQTGSWRITMWGDDEAGTCIIVNKGVTLNASGWAAFGLPEDEFLYPTIPPNPETMQRLFVMGSPRQSGSLDWRTDFFTPTLTSPPPNNCIAWSEDEYPIPASLSTYADVFNQTTHFKSVAQAGTSSFGGYTEVIDVEIIAGMFDTIFAPTTSSIFTFQPRRVGRFPMARLGRANYVTWSHSPDNPGDAGAGPKWLHTERGIFLPWGGPPLSGSFTGSLVWPISGSIFDDEGTLLFVGNTPGADPEPDPRPFPHDVDATRYKKTYSYFRQPVVAVGYVKGGSNKPK